MAAMWTVAAPAPGSRRSAAACSTTTADPAVTGPAATAPALPHCSSGRPGRRSVASLSPRSRRVGGRMCAVNMRTRNNVTVTGREDGPAVLLAHGFGCDQNLWRLVVPELAARYRVVLFDHT